MIQVVKCPSCAAPLEIDDDKFEICDFCGSSLSVSPDDTFSPDSFGFEGLLTQAQKLKEVFHLVRAGNKIEAIKIYRETFGGSLADAKEMVENLATGKQLNFTNNQTFSFNESFQYSAQPFGQPNNLSEIQSELRRGNKINAIKIYRETFNVGLKEAKDAVEALERGEAVHFQSNESSFNFQSNRSFTVNNLMYKKPSKILVFIIFIFIILTILGGAFLSLGGRFLTGLRSLTTSKNSTFDSVKDKNNSGKTAFASEILRFGGEGVGGGFFKDNRLIAADGEDRVYSVNYSGGQLQQFDGNGKFLAQWNIGENINLLDLAADKKNRIYVLSSRNLEIFDGSTQQSLSRIASPNYQSLALDANGKLYAITSNNELVKLDEKGKISDKPVSFSKQVNYKSGKLNNLAIDGAGNFYVYDESNKYILKYSPDAKYLIRFDNPSNEKKELGSVHDLAVDGKGRIFAAETNEIHVFDNDGRYLSSFETRQSFGLAFDSKNFLWTASRPFIVKYELNQ